MSGIWILHDGPDRWTLFAGEGRWRDRRWSNARATPPLRSIVRRGEIRALREIYEVALSERLRLPPSDDDVEVMVRRLERALSTGELLAIREERIAARDDAGSWGLESAGLHEPRESSEASIARELLQSEEPTSLTIQGSSGPSEPRPEETSSPRSTSPAVSETEPKASSKPRPLRDTTPTTPASRAPRTSRIFETPPLSVAIDLTETASSNEPPPPSEDLGPETWFEVRVIDELGEPVPGVALSFELHGASRSAITDGDGTARIEGVRTATGAVAFADVPGLRALLLSRWAQLRTGDVLPAEFEGTRLPLRRDMPRVAVISEIPLPIAILPSTVRVRLIGMHFESSKCFLLPKAMKGIRKVKQVYDRHDDPTLLVVGHTDTKGPDWYNEPLSLERAQAVSSYLSDRVADWLAWYKNGDVAKRWGTKEDQHMLSALPWGEVPYHRGKVTGVLDAATRDAIGRFQGDKGLAVTGQADGATREAMVRDYMALDGTSLPADAEVVVHGCGPYFNDVETGPGVALEANRRVELYVFDGPVQPPPPGKISKRGTPQYPAWKARTTETVDFTVGEEEQEETFRIRLHDDRARPLSSVAYWLRVPGQEPIEAVSDDGWVEITYPKDMCFEAIDLAWVKNAAGDYVHRRDFILECTVGSERDQATAKLHNLGFPSSTPYEEAVVAFQERYGLPEHGLANGALPPMTKAKLWDLYEGECDASPPG